MEIVEFIGMKEILKVEILYITLGWPNWFKLRSPILLLLLRRGRFQPQFLPERLLAPRSGPAALKR